MTADDKLDRLTADAENTLYHSYEEGFPILFEWMREVNERIQNLENENDD